MSQETNPNKGNLRVAQCCGSCFYVNKPKGATGHDPHYSEAKTERWCYFHKQATYREAVCDDHTIVDKGSPKSNLTRVTNQNKNLQKILEIKQWMTDNSIQEIQDTKSKDRSYIINKEGFLCYTYSWSHRTDGTILSYKDSIKEVISAYESAKESMNNPLV